MDYMADQADRQIDGGQYTFNEMLAEIDQLKLALTDAINVLRMVDDNHRVDAGEKRKAWDGKFVIAEVRRVLG